LYARTGSENNNLYPQVNLLATTDLYERIFTLETSVNVSQQYLSPLGARPDSLATTTNNQYTSQAYRFTPILKGETLNGIRYDVRDDNIFTRGNVTGVNDAYANDLQGHLERPPAPFGWGADYERTQTRFQTDESNVSQLVRGRLLYQPDPQYRVWASIGYELNDFQLTDYNDGIYGLGFSWRPTERTSLDAEWEHRFFGPSYNVNFNHRMALSYWSAYASRGTTSYPQEIASLTTGTDVNATLNALFASRIPDPVARQNAINQYIRDRGLPQFLDGPVNLYTQSITLEERLGASVAITGARNSVFVNAYRLRSEAIAGSGEPVPEVVPTFTDTTQYGANLVWSYSLTPSVALTFTVDAARTINNGDVGGTTRQGSVRALVSTQVTPLTSVYGSIRYQALRSDVVNNYNEAALIFGMIHTFR